MKPSVQINGNVAVVTLGSAIDETFPLQIAPLIKQTAEMDLKFDCRNVAQINSLGCKGWTDMLAGLAKRRITFECCTDPIIDYASIISGFFGAGTIDSLLLGYQCDNCGTVTKLATPLAAVRSGLAKQKLACSRCGESATCSVDLENLDFLPSKT